MELDLLPRDVPAGYDRADLETVLCGMFASALQLGAVAPDDDFFDLGGDSITAVALAVEVEKATGIHLPTTTLFDAPTVAALARLLDEQTPTIPSSVIRLKAGSGEPALFIAPGIAGSAIELLPLARGIDCDGPVYGLRAPGLAEPEVPLDRIEAMAAHYVPLIRAVQPFGPYYIAGYSLGGLTAVEIGRLLVAAGERVALLALLDTAILPNDLGWSTRLRIWGRRTAHHARQLRGLRLRDALPYAVRRIPAMLTDLGSGARARRVQRMRSRQSVPAATKRVIEGGFAAAAHYRQRFFPGTVTFIEAVENRGVPLHPDIVWCRQAERVVIHRVAGDHFDMMERNVDALAASLSARIREATWTG